MIDHLFPSFKLKIIRISVVMGLIIIYNTFSFISAQMEEACELFYNGDPSELKDSTIDVPDETVALSPKVKIDMPTDTHTVIGGTPSIFFIIDHSGSMYQNPGNDIDGKRFTVTLEFIDSIRAKFPSAEVGIAVFRQHLYFDPADSAYFVPLTAYPQGSYMPFYKLDSSYINHGGNNGRTVVQNILRTRTVSNYVDLEYVPTNVATNSASTNINVGFAAAKHAFQPALYAKNRQFIIFLSDGDATEYNGPNTSNWDFVSQVDGISTTFTVFFTSTGMAPQNLVTMTNNIQSNGYSSNNPHSNIWAVDVANLMDVLMDEVMVIITGTIVGLPVDITVNGTTVSDYDTINNQFTFDTHFPLTGVQTDFEYKINYTIAKDSILPNGDTIVVVGDSTSEGNFSVVVDPTVTDPPDWYPHEFELICWQRELGLFYNDTHVTVINEAMTPLELRFVYNDSDANYNYTEADIEVVTTEGPAQDKEMYTLSGSGNTFSGTFPRYAIDDNQTPTQGNGTIEHYMVDTLVATFRNKENSQLPLDTIRATAQFGLSGLIQINCGYYFDNNADGFVDSIFVDVTTDVAGGLTDFHVQEILDSAFTLPSFRRFTINTSGVVSGGFFIDVTEDNTNPTTYITSDDKLTVIEDILSIGGWLKDTIAPIYDKVAPIIHWKDKAAYLVDYQVDTIADTLGVKFSEPIENITHAQPFYFLDVSSNPDTNYTVTLDAVSQPSADSMVFVVRSTGVKYIEDGDSIWIQGTGRVTDNAGNSQNNSKNTRRRIWVWRIFTQYELIPNAVSPIDLSKIDSNDYVIPYDIIDILFNQGILDDLDLSQNSNGDYTGMLISVTPDNIQFLLPDFRLIGDIDISDDDGNEVVPESKMAWYEKNKSLVWVWNCKNQNGQYVYTGKYTCYIEMRETTPSLYPDGNGPVHGKTFTVEILGDYKSDDSCGGCGTSSELAFIPPIGFKLTSIFRRRKKWWWKFFKRQ